MTLRDTMIGRPRPTLPYLIRTSDTTAAERAMSEAQARLQIALLTGNAEGAVSARGDLEAAQDVYEACCSEIVLTALPPDDYELLLDKHPPREDSTDEKWNGLTFGRACFMACAPEELTEQEWAAVLIESLSKGEREELYLTAIAVNIRTPDPNIPKGWMGTQD